MNYSQFHDGIFEGLWIDDNTAHLFLSTEKRIRYVLTAQEVTALALNGFRQGNIIFEVLSRKSQEAVITDIEILYDLQSNPVGRNEGIILMKKLHGQNLTLLELNPSYGASAMLLASSLELVERKIWLENTFNKPS